MPNRLGVAVAGLACFVAGTSWARCSKDTDCKGDRICVAGTCSQPDTPRVEAPARTPAIGDRETVERLRSEVEQLTAQRASLVTPIAQLVIAGIGVAVGSTLLALGVDQNNVAVLVLSVSIPTVVAGLALLGGTLWSRSMTGREIERREREIAALVW